jgi:hypothetical protein
MGEYGAAIELRKRAFAAFRARGEMRCPAVLAAYWLAFDYAAVCGWVELACALATDDFDAKESYWRSSAYATVPRPPPTRHRPSRTRVCGRRRTP